MSEIPSRNFRLQPVINGLPKPENRKIAAVLPAMREPLRMQAVQSPIIPVVGELIKKHPGTISLGQGVVYYGPPEEVHGDLGRFWSEPENHKYKLVQGIPGLLEIIAEKLRSENRILMNSTNALVVTAGGNLAFMNAVLAITDPGDEVVLQLPYYFNHEMAIAMAGCKAVLVDTDENYQLRLDAIERAINSRTRAIVTISPNNPTGAVYPESALRDVNALCQKRGLYHIHDEAYEYFTYDGVNHFSPGSIDGSADTTISLFSLSKAYGFASWRIGYMVVPEPLLVSVKKIQDTILICPPVVSQYAAIGALRAGRRYPQSKRSPIVKVRDLLLRELRGIRSFCAVPPANGAFYFLLRLNTDKGPMELVEALIQDHGVAVIPGTAFGIQHGCYLRVAYGALESDKAREGVGRLMNGLKSILK